MLKINIIALYQTLRVLHTEHYFAHIFFSNPRSGPGWLQMSANGLQKSGLRRPTDVGKGKMNRGSIDKICMAHLIIPRLCRMPRMMKKKILYCLAR